MKNIFRIAGLLSAGLILVGCSSKPVTRQFFAMDTYMSISAYGQNANEASASGEQEVNILENTISRTQGTTELAELNQTGGEWIEVSPDLYDILEKAKALAVLTDGAFDPTVSALSDLWQIGTEKEHIPTQAEIDAALTTVGYENLELRQEGEVYKVRLLNGAELDLGGIGKGIATDRCMEKMSALQGEKGAGIIQLGGNVGVYGKNPKRGDGTWHIALTSPDEEQDELGFFTVETGTAVTSGNYERYFEQDGVRYHHIFDCKTGYPAWSGLKSVTIIAEKGCSAQADAFSTALFVMGLEKGIEFVKTQENMEVIFVTEKNEIILTPGLLKDFTLSDSAKKAGYAIQAADW